MKSFFKWTLVLILISLFVIAIAKGIYSLEDRMSFENIGNRQKPSKNIYKMKINDQTQMGSWYILRVPGGWLYFRHTIGTDDSLPVFVEYQAENSH